MADQIVTTAQVKAQLGVTDATDDALISSLIDRVSSYIEATTGRKLVPDDAATYYVDTVYGHTIRVPRGIRTVTSLAVAATDQPDDGSGTYQAVTATDILLRPSAIERPEGWPATTIILRQSPISTTVPLRTASNGAKIVGNFGFAAVPLELVGVAIDAVIATYIVRRNAAADAIGETDTSVIARYFGAGAAYRILRRYRGGDRLGFA